VPQLHESPLFLARNEAPKIAEFDATGVTLVKRGTELGKRTLT
jgi:hypothetical protein